MAERKRKKGRKTRQRKEPRIRKRENLIKRLKLQVILQYTFRCEKCHFVRYGKIQNLSFLWPHEAKSHACVTIFLAWVEKSMKEEDII